MQSQRINITLPVDLVRDLKKTIPHRSRSRFIAETLREKLAKKRNLKRELVKSLKANYNFDKEEMKDWTALDFEGWPEWEEK